MPAADRGTDVSAESGAAVTLAAPPVDLATDSHSPYPGLRPFLEFESAYFYGRATQVGEIIDRLRRTKFVAVLGGSGSGKSSLVLAGVIPDLRTFAVAEAGDFWVPIVSTPGTNHAPGDSPATRLARRFCAALKPVEEPAAGQRVADCTRMLRSADGFAEMVERYGGELADAAELDPRKANFLLLIDQFEELFHHSNRTLPDCDRLVERVIDNFKSPHPRVFVIITMRSEHLSDCARYLDLPDAINRASYLVPRLNAQQIGESIEKPALRYLRLLARRASQRLRRERGGAPASAGPSVPAASELDPVVRDRLIADAEALRDKPDHLPLLQHLLFRLWEAARKRASRNGAVAPERIETMDLRRAVWAEVERADPAELPKGNCLQVCLEQWAQRLYGERPEHAASLDEVLRRLAFKEPNTGTYTQQRAGFDELVQTLGLPSEAALRALLEPWLTPHSYLFWDTESRTVKVAHESFIRGWSHFSRCIDEEDERFQEFVRLLDECQRWQGAEGTLELRRKQLIGGSRLRRVLDVGLDRALERAQDASHLASLLKLHREGERLAPAVPVVSDFLQRSVNEEKRREDAEAQRVEAERRTKTRRRRRITSVVAVGLVFLLALAMSWWVEFRFGERERLLHRAYAFDVETVLATDYQFSNLEAAQLPLRNVLVGSWHLDRSHEPASGALVPLDWLTNLYAHVALRKRLDGAERTSILAEMRAVAALRTVLGLAVWPVTRADAGASESPPPSRCTLSIEGAQGPAAAPGVRARGPGAAPRRVSLEAWFHPRASTPAIGFAVMGGGPEPFQVYAARLSPSGQCDRGTPIVSIPPDKDVRIAFDADLRNVFLAVSEMRQGASDGQRSVQRYEIAWPSSGTDPKVQERARISSAGFAQAIWGENDPPLVRLPSVAEERHNAIDLKVANGWVRVFHLEPITLSAPASSWTPLTDASEEECVELRDYIDAQVRMAAERSGVPSDQLPKRNMLQGKLPDGKWVCVLVTRRDGPGGTNSSLSVYRAVPDQPDVNKRVAIFPEIDFGAGDLKDVRLGPRGDHDGWLAAARPDGTWIGAPWSLDAWHRFSREVCNFEPVSGLDQRRYAPVFDLIRGTSESLSTEESQAMCPKRAGTRSR
jgi:hypothetical protein